MLWTLRVHGIHCLLFLVEREIYGLNMAVGTTGIESIKERPHFCVVKYLIMVLVLGVENPSSFCPSVCGRYNAC